MTRQQYGSELRSLQTDKQNDALLVKLLREIADNTKNDAKNSAEELVRRLGISSKSDASKWIENLEGKRTGSATDILRRQEAANIIRQQYGFGGSTGGGLLGESLNGLPSMIFGGLGGGFGGGLLNTLGRFGTAALPAALTVGTGLGVFNRYSNTVEAGRDVSVVNGGSLRDVWDMSLQ